MPFMNWWAADHINRMTIEKPANRYYTWKRLVGWKVGWQESKMNSRRKKSKALINIGSNSTFFILFLSTFGTHFFSHSRSLSHFISPLAMFIILITKLIFTFNWVNFNAQFSICTLFYRCCSFTFLLLFL